MDILQEFIPVLLTALVGLIGWAVVRLEKLVKSTDTDIDDKVFNAVKKAFTDLDGKSPERED